MGPFYRNYACAGEGDGYIVYCISCATSGQVITVNDVNGCNPDSNGDPSTRIVSTTVEKASVCGGYIPQVVYIRESSAPSTTNTTTTTSTQADPPSSTTTSSSSSSSSTASLSTGAKAGISIAVALVVILLLIGAVLLYKRRARSRTGTLPETEAQDAYAKPELASEEWARSELPGNSAHISELSDEAHTPGPSGAYVAELDGGEVIRPSAHPQSTT